MSNKGEQKQDAKKLKEGDRVRGNLGVSSSNGIAVPYATLSVMAMAMATVRPGLHR